jgi:serine protease Do
VNVSAKREAEAVPSPGGPGGLRGPRGEQPFDEFFRRFFEHGPTHPVPSLGSGFIVNPEGYIVTNNHVVEHASRIQVKLADGRELPATVVGRDPRTDLALLRIEATGLPVIPLGDSSALRVGEPVMAIGNPFGLEQTVTTGIVSATGRVIGSGPYDDFIQTDASINPGNSGGPLINGRGEVVGINTAIFSRSGGSVGIGFAIPSNLAKSVITQLAESGHVVRAWLGVTIQPVTAALAKGFGTPDTTGALVSSVSEDSPAMKAGLRPGDVIVEYDGRPVARAEDLPRAVAQTQVGREVAVTVIRDGQPHRLTARVAQLEEPAVRTGTTREGAKGRLGLSVAPLSPGLARELGLREEKGLVVREVAPGSPAAAAGLQPNDVIVEVNRQPVGSVDELRATLDRGKKDAPVLFLVRRGDGTLYLAVSA